MNKDVTILAGFHGLSVRLNQAPQSIEIIYHDGARHDKRLQSLLDRARQHGIRIEAETAQQLDGRSGGVRHQGVVAVVSALPMALTVEEVFEKCPAQPFFLILDGVTDPHNLGACLRTADAAGVDAVIAPKNHSAALSTTARRVACGAAETVPYILVTNLARTMRDLQDRGVWLIGTDDQAAHHLYDADLSGPVAWVMGAEGKGLRRLTQETCDQLVQIPMQGAVESLNVSVASAVCLYETVRQRRLSRGR